MCFADSQIAVLRRGPFTACVDAGEQVLWHHHRGRPNLLLFVGDELLLIDPGCGNYDATLRVDYLQRPKVHNVVVVEAPAVASAKATDPEVSIESFAPDAIVVRSVRLAADAVTVDDRLSAASPVEARLLWHLAPVNVVLQDERRRAVARLAGGDVEARLGPLDLQA